MIEKVNELSNAASVNGVKGKKGVYLGFEADEVQQSQDALAVSSFAREMANISAELKKTSDIREEKVEALRSQIAAGTYNPDLNAVAARLVWAGLTKTEG